MAEPQLIIAGESFSADRRAVARPEAQALDFRPAISAAQNVANVGEELQKVDDAQALANAQQQATEEMDLLRRELQAEGGAANAQAMFIERSNEISGRINGQLGSENLQRRFGTIWDDLYSNHRLKVIDSAMSKGVAVSRDLFRATASRLTNAAAEEDDPRLFRNWMGQLDKGIDDQVADGLITPAEAAVDRATYMRRAALKTAERLIDRDPAQARALVEGGHERFAALSDEDKAALLEKAGNVEIRKRAEGAVKRRKDEAGLKARIRRDVEKTEVDGNGDDDGDDPLTHERVERTLGTEVADTWRKAKRLAEKTFNVLNPMKSMTADDLAEYAGRMPETEDGVSVVTHAEKVLKDRAKDPVRAAVDAFGGEDIDPDAEPDAIAAAVQRRDEAQDALGIDEAARRVLTNAEAARFAERMGELNLTAKNSVAPFMRELDMKFGKSAEAAFRDILLMSTDDQDLARVGAAVGRKVGLGIQPSLGDAKTLQTVKSAGDAEKAFRPSSSVQDSSQYRPAEKVPNAQQIQMLMAKPDLAAQFEQKFGAGSAAFHLQAGSAIRSRSYFEDGGTVTVTPDGKETWVPGKETLGEELVRKADGQP